jgi:hypothetical protein
VLCGETSLECLHLALKLMPFGIQIGKTRSNPRQVRLNIALVGHWRFPSNPFRPVQHIARKRLA